MLPLERPRVTVTSRLPWLARNSTRHAAGQRTVVVTSRRPATRTIVADRRLRRCERVPTAIGRRRGTRADPADGRDRDAGRPLVGPHPLRPRVPLERERLTTVDAPIGDPEPETLVARGQQPAATRLAGTELDLVDDHLAACALQCRAGLQLEPFGFPAPAAAPRRGQRADEAADAQIALERWRCLNDEAAAPGLARDGRTVLSGLEDGADGVVGDPLCAISSPVPSLWT